MSIMVFAPVVLIFKYILSVRFLIFKLLFNESWLDIRYKNKFWVMIGQFYFWKAQMFIKLNIFEHDLFIL